MPKAPKFSYDYQKGSPWMYETLTAQFDFPVLKTEAQIQQEMEKAWQSVIPYYRLNKSVSQQAEKQPVVWLLLSHCLIWPHNKIL